MPQHITRLILLMVVLAAAAYAAQRFFTVDSFYQYGHYRGASVAEIASEKPKFKGTASCQTCHAERFAEWSKGGHNKPDAGKVVRCEVCHGAAGERDVLGAFQVSTTGPDHPNNLKLALPGDSRKLCTLCHERMTGRPAQQPQIVVAEHAGAQQCTACHDPHSPKLNLAPAATAQGGDAALGKVKAAACTGCHGAEDAGAGLPGPSLAGQNPAYFVEALKAYSTGGRNDPMMSAAAQGITSEDGADLAAYFASLRCASRSGVENQAVAAGQGLAAQCVACHGADGRSTNGAWPNLFGLSKDYLLTSLKAYKDGSRKNGMMAGIVKAMSDKDTENVASYYANASCR